MSSPFGGSNSPGGSTSDKSKGPLPNPYQISVLNTPDTPQVEKIKQRIKDRYKVGTYRRWTFECRWLLNILWAMGSQWTRVDPRGQKVVNMKLPLGFPRAVTNKYAKVNDDLLNSIISGDIQFNYMPGTDDPKDLGVAEVSDRLHEVIDEETRAKERKRLLGFWFTYTGNGFIFPYYDYGPEHGTIPVPIYNCAACSAMGQQTQVMDATKPCPTCGAPPTSMPAVPPPPPPGPLASLGPPPLSGIGTPPPSPGGPTPPVPAPVPPTPGQPPTSSPSPPPPPTTPDYLQGEGLDDTGGAPPPPPQPTGLGGVAAGGGAPPVPPPPQPIPNFTPAMGPDGNPQTKDIPIGAICFDVASPFEVYQDNTIPSGSDGQRWYLRFKRTDIDVAKQNWVPFADKIVEGMQEAFPMSRNYLLAIAYAGSISSDYGYGDSVSKESMRRQINVWELNELPTPDFPDGLRAVQIGDFIVEATPLKTVWSAGAKKGQPWLPRVQFTMSDVGSAWGKPRADYLIPLQFRRNIIESSLQLTAQRTGAPKLLTPEGCKVKNVTGEAGQLLTYNPISLASGTGIKPEYLEAALGNVAPLTELIKNIDSDMEAIAGTFFLTGGDAPAGVTAASALSYLGEKSHQAVAPVKEHWAESWSQCYQYALELARTNWVDGRTLSVLGQNKTWEFQKFKQADLAGSVNVRVDYQALFPKSQATERATIMQLYQMAVLQPGDPDTDFLVLEAFGETKLKNLTNGAFSQAQREWDRFLNQNIPPQLKPIVQNSPLHLIQHKKDAQSQEYENLPPDKQALWDAHIQATMMDIMAQQAMAQEAAGGGGQPAPGGPPPSGPHGHTQPGSQHGSQKGAAGGNGIPKEPASVQKGKSAADADAGPPPAIKNIGR
jgi:hypothetical protein